MATTLKDTNEKELNRMLAEKRVGLQKFRFGVSGSKVKNVREGRVLRKDIARILTELKAKSKATK